MICIVDDVRKNHCRTQATVAEAPLPCAYQYCWPTGFGTCSAMPHLVRSRDGYTVRCPRCGMYTAHRYLYRGREHHGYLLPRWLQRLTWEQHDPAVQLVAAWPTPADAIARWNADVKRLRGLGRCRHVTPQLRLDSWCSQ